MINRVTGCQERRIWFVGYRLLGVYFLLVFFRFLGTFFSSEHVICSDDIIMFFFLLFLLLFLFTSHATFDNSNFVLHYFFFKKSIPLLSFTYFRYYMFGIYSLRFRRCGELEAKGTALVGFCSRKAMKPFLAVLREKNLACEIYE